MLNECISNRVPTLVSRRSLPRKRVPRMLSWRNSSPSFRIPLASLAAITDAVPEPHGDLFEVLFCPESRYILICCQGFQDIHLMLPVQHGCEGVWTIPIQLPVRHRGVRYIDRIN